MGPPQVNRLIFLVHCSGICFYFWFTKSTIRLDVGVKSPTSTLDSTVPETDSEGAYGNFINGSTESEKGLTPLPALAMVWASEESRHSFGVSIFGISGLAVAFPENNTNPILASQSFGGFGRIESNYSLLQLGFTYAYELTDKLSIGVQPSYNFAQLQLMPNPTAQPNASGYPSTDNASSSGVGGQAGLYFDSKTGFTAGLA